MKRTKNREFLRILKIDHFKYSNSLGWWQTTMKWQHENRMLHSFSPHLSRLLTHVLVTHKQYRFFKSCMKFPKLENS